MDPPDPPGSAPKCSLFLGGGSVRNVGSNQTSPTDMIIFWDHAASIPPRGYRIAVPSLRIWATNVKSTSFMISKATVGKHIVEIQPHSIHYLSVKVTYVAILKGEILRF